MCGWNKCGKTIYVAERSIASRELEYLILNYKKKFYAVEGKPFFSIQSGVEYSSIFVENFHNYLTRLFESGIYKEISELLQEQKHLKRRLLTIKLFGGGTQRFADNVRPNGSI